MTVRLFKHAQVCMEGTGFPTPPPPLKYVQLGSENTANTVLQRGSGPNKITLESSVVDPD